MNQIAKNTAWLSLAFLSSKGISFLWQLSLARLFNLDPEIYSAYITILSIIAITTTLSEFGLSITIQQVWFKKEFSEPEYVQAAIVNRLITTAASCIILFVAMKYTFGTKVEVITLILFTIHFLLLNLGDLPSGFWMITNRAKLLAVSGLITSALIFLCQIFFMQIDKSLNMLGFGSVMASITSSIISFILFRKNFSFRFTKTESTFAINKQLFSLGLPAVISASLFVMYYRIDTVLLTKWSEPINAGQFGLASMMYMAMVDLLWSQFGKAYFPSMSEYWHSDKRNSKLKTLRKILTAYLFIGLLAACAFFIYGNFFFALLFGSESPWVKSDISFLFLTLGFWPHIILGLAYRILYLDNRHYSYTRCVALATSLKLFLVLFLIPLYGATGSAVSNLVCQIFMGFATFLALPENCREVVSKLSVLLYSLTVVIIILYI